MWLDQATRLPCTGPEQNKSAGRVRVVVEAQVISVPLERLNHSLYGQISAEASGVGWDFQEAGQG